MNYVSRLYLHEATLRMMAGASPNKTQQLLDKSGSVKTGGGRGLVCGRDKDVYAGEREHALALMLACKHLPPQLHSSPAETAGEEHFQDIFGCDSTPRSPNVCLYVHLYVVTLTTAVLQLTTAVLQLTTANYS